MIVKRNHYYKINNNGSGNIQVGASSSSGQGQGQAENINNLRRGGSILSTDKNKRKRLVELESGFRYLMNTYVSFYLWQCVGLTIVIVFELYGIIFTKGHNTFTNVYIDFLDDILLLGFLNDIVITALTLNGFKRYLKYNYLEFSLLV